MKFKPITKQQLWDTVAVNTSETLMAHYNGYDGPTPHQNFIRIFTVDEEFMFLLP